MSTESQDAAGNAACPLCDDYEGAPSSVEAHISRMTDVVHQGEVGRAHRADIQRQAGGADGEESADADEEAEDVDETDDVPGGLPMPSTEAMVVGAVVVAVVLYYLSRSSSSSSTNARSQEEEEGMRRQTSGGLSG